MEKKNEYIKSKVLSFFLLSFTLKIHLFFSETSFIFPEKSFFLWFMPIACIVSSSKEKKLFQKTLKIFLNMIREYRVKF